MADAWAAVSRVFADLTPPTVVAVSAALVGATTVTPIMAPAAVPPTPCSRLDGYAVVAAHTPPGEYTVAGARRPGMAGDTKSSVAAGEVVWVTTGAPLPPGADAVVPVEATEARDTPSRVFIKRAVAAGNGVRPAGSDWAAGDVVVEADITITPAHIAAMLQAGVLTALVRCSHQHGIGAGRAQVRVHVLSTGDELVDAASMEAGAAGPLVGHTVDSNRPMLMALLQELGAGSTGGGAGSRPLGAGPRHGSVDIRVIDHGSIPDDISAVRGIFSAVVASAAVADGFADVIVTTGGVSMGDRDFVKPVLAELGTVHFGRLNMKPGKPTTFATLPRGSGRGAVPVFALPGNPVSAFVCFHMLVAPALRMLSGAAATWAAALPPAVPVTMLDGVHLDAERPEFHRVTVWAGTAAPSGAPDLTLTPVATPAAGGSLSQWSLWARSTGSQASSRLASTAGANALLFLPAAPRDGAAPFVAAPFVSHACYLLAPPLTAHDLPRDLASTALLRNDGVDGGGGGCGCGMPHDVRTPTSAPVPPAAGATVGSAAGPGIAHPSFAHVDTIRVAAAAAPSGGATGAPPVTATARPTEPLLVRVCVLTVSTRCAAGSATDSSGPRIAAWLTGGEAGERMRAEVVSTAVVPDDESAIGGKVCEWLHPVAAAAAASAPPLLPDLIVTTGGTGMSGTDVTPEALRPLIERPAHGLVHAMLSYGCTQTPLAALSRYEAGAARRGDGRLALIVEMPGSVKAVVECLTALRPLLPHALALLRT